MDITKKMIKYSTTTTTSTNHARPSCFLLTCILVILVLSVKCSMDDENVNKESKMHIIDAAKSLFSLPTSYDCWKLKMKALFQRGKPYFPPETSTHTSHSGGEEEGMIKMGATEKVKEAAVKSLDKSKSTVEESARKAAKLAEEAVENTVKKLKKTLSGRQHEPQEL